MILTGKVLSIGRHDRDGESIHGVLIEVPRKQLQQGGLLYREVIVHTDYHAKIQNPEVFNVDLLERERDDLATRATALAVRVDELTRERDDARERMAIAIADRDSARGRADQVWKLREEFVALLGTDDIEKGVEAVRNLLARVQRLEKLGGRLRKYLRIAVGPDAHGWETPGGVDIGKRIEAAISDWEKAKEAKP